MKGYLLLSLHRSGTYWLCDLANAEAKMGSAGEWLKPKHLGVRPEDFTAESFFQLVIQKATANGFFGVKIFPTHLRWVQEFYGFDFIAECQKRHEVKLIFVERRDRMKQAVSFAKSKMTGQWKSTAQRTGEAEYDFDEICRARFYLEEGYAYWRAYFGLRDLKPDSFAYEDLVSDPSPFLRALTSHFGVEPPAELRSVLQVQRDASTDLWIERFRAESDRNVLGLNGSRSDGCPLSLLRRLKRKVGMKHRLFLKKRRR